MTGEEDGNSRKTMCTMGGSGPNGFQNLTESEGESISLIIFT